MASGPKRIKRRTRLNGRTIDIRALLEDREFIKVTAFMLPHAIKARVLELMERLRRERMEAGLRAETARTPALPEMTDGELLREITWRLDTLPPGDAETVARFARHVTRWYTDRQKKAARARRRQAMPAPGSR